MRTNPMYAGALQAWGLALNLSLQGTPVGEAAETRIRVALDYPVRTWDPRQSVEGPAAAFDDLLHCSLMTLDAEGRTGLGIAAAEPVWTSPQVLEVRVKDSVKFSDGSALTAADVAATWRSLLIDPQLPRAASVRALKEVAAQGSRVIFTLKEADPAFIGKLALGILPGTFASAPHIDAARLPVCGPYFIKSLEAARVVLEQNPHYPKTATQPRLPLEFQVIPQEKMRSAQLLKGEIDLVQNSLSPIIIKELAKHPQLLVKKRAGLSTTFLGFNPRDPLSGHPAVRAAIAHAINRKDIIELVLGGMASPAATLVPPASAFHVKALRPRSWDLTRAETILEAAGWKKKGGIRLTLSYKTSAEIKEIQIAKAIASQLQKIGIRIVVEPLEKKILEADTRQGRMQIWSATATNVTSLDAVRAFPGGNENPQLNALLEQGQISRSPEQRRKIYQDAQDILEEDLPYIYLWHEDQFAVMNKALRGYTLSADGRYTALPDTFKSD